MTGATHGLSPSAFFFFFFPFPFGERLSIQSDMACVHGTSLERTLPCLDGMLSKPLYKVNTPPPPKKRLVAQ